MKNVLTDTLSKTKNASFTDASRETSELFKAAILRNNRRPLFY